MMYSIFRFALDDIWRINRIELGYTDLNITPPQVFVYILNIVSDRLKFQVVWYVVCGTHLMHQHLFAPTRSSENLV